MTIRRQDFSTQIHELRGDRCEQFLAVASCENPLILPLFYLKVNGRWHRFYLDAGLLFWAEGEAPDEDDDLLDNEYYRDIGHDFQVVGIPIHTITFAECVLTLAFANGMTLVFEETDDGECVIHAPNSC